MSDKFLKDITNYNGNETFKNFRETLVNEVSENFNTIEEKISSYENNNKNLYLIFQNKSIDVSVNNYIKKLELSSDLSKEIVNNYNSLYLKVDFNSSHSITIDLLDAKNTGSSNHLFYLFSQKMSNNVPNWRPYVFECDVFVYSSGASLIRFYTNFFNESDVADINISLYGKK